MNTLEPFRVPENMVQKAKVIQIYGSTGELALNNKRLIYDKDIYLTPM
jgi:hypothetical protein